MERRGTKMEIKAHTVSAGKAEGEAIVYRGPFSFLGDLDPNTGKCLAPRHKLEGQSLVNKVFVCTTGKGSSAGDSTAWAIKQKNNVPAAMICLETEPILTSAVLVTGIPTVDRPEKDVFELIKTGDYVKVDATAGIIEVVGK
jgi:predicted aconitase with swiveling domain